MIINIFLFLLLFLFILFNFYYKKNIDENFYYNKNIDENNIDENNIDENNIDENNFDENKKIDYYVISIKTNLNKLYNIKKNNQILKKKINIYNAIIGKEIDLNNLSFYDPLIKNNVNFAFIGELGCYLSHLLLIKSLKESKKQYTVIFEDDLYILENNLDKKINNIVDNLNTLNYEFDIIFLGNLNDNHKEKIIDNIYTIDSSNHLWGTHAYLINNKSAEKIYNSILEITDPIDIKLVKNLNNNIIKGYVIYPNLVNQNRDIYPSDIRI